MTFNEYQERAGITAEYPLYPGNLVYPAMGLCGEAGELLDKIKKQWRNKNKEFLAKKDCTPEYAALVSLHPKTLTIEQRFEIIKELGDVLWYVAAIARELNVELDEVAITNINKLMDRLQRNKVCSEGDNR